MKITENSDAHSSNCRNSRSRLFLCVRYWSGVRMRVEVRVVRKRNAAMEFQQQNRCSVSPDIVDAVAVLQPHARPLKRP
ncbi:MAG: hypothetical protein U0529_08910 [Thermoanaerobaculia bacterium]